jgi:hypothetical protein
MKIVSIVNFVRGGKSSIARLLAEKLDTSILNFDPKRDAHFYNAVKTMNIPDNAKITRAGEQIKIETDEDIINISSKSNMFVCDFGGRFDERINEFESDIYIMPTMDDFESISETIKATKYILKGNPNAKILHVLNMAMCINKKERKDFVSDYQELIVNNKLRDIPFIQMPRSKLIKRLVNDCLKKSDIIGDSKFLALGSYKGINNFTDTLVEIIKKEIGV